VDSSGIPCQMDVAGLSMTLIAPGCCRGKAVGAHPGGIGAGRRVVTRPLQAIGGGRRPPSGVDHVGRSSRHLFEVPVSVSRSSTSRGRPGSSSRHQIGRQPPTMTRDRPRPDRLKTGRNESLERSNRRSGQLASGSQPILDLYPEASDAHPMTDPFEWDAQRYGELPLPHVAWGEGVLARLAPSPGARVLEVGCGTGRDAARLLGARPDAISGWTARSRCWLQPGRPWRTSAIACACVASTCANHRTLGPSMAP